MGIARVSLDGKSPSAVTDVSDVASRIIRYAGAVKSFSIPVTKRDECILTEKAKGFIEAV